MRLVPEPVSGFIALSYLVVAFIARSKKHHCGWNIRVV